MNNEIKNRIEQIKNGKVPKGYKRGKIGIVPEEWEEVTFSSLFTSTSDYTDDLKTYPLYSLTIEDGVTAKTERYDRAHLVKKENSYKIVRPNDYAYNPMNLRFGAVARYNGSSPVAVSGYYDIFTTVHQSDLLFMDSFLTCSAMLTYYNRMSTGSLVEKKRVHFSEFLKFSIPLPPLEEREKIAKILNTQDVVIELTEKRIEQLKQMKKYYLQNMFPKHGETVPKIRFKGFTDAWEQRKLVDCFDFLQNNTLSREALQAGQGVAINVHYGDVLIKFGEYLDIATESISYIPSQSIVDKFKGSLLADGDVIMADTAEDETVGKCSEIVGLRGKAALSGLHTIPLRPIKKFASGFLGYYMNSGAYHDQLLPLMQGIKVTSISKSAIKGTNIYYPDNLMEQASIGQFFILLDNFITLHQRKLEEEKRKKKSLAQLLLSGIVRV